MLNILLTSVGRRTYLVNYFKKALQGIGKVHAANSQHTYAIDQADHAITTPLIYEDGYIEFLLNYCQKNEIRAIIPLFDIDIPVLAKHKEEFKAQGVVVVVPDEKFAKTCNDKWLTFQFFREHGFHTPETFLSIDDCLGSINNGKISFPVIVKPRWGMGSIGIFEADNIPELEVLYKKSQKDVFSTYLKHESEENNQNAVIIQEKITGAEYGINIFNDLQGNFLSGIALKKTAMRAGETDVAVVISNERLQELGKTLANISRHPGNMDIDCFLVNDCFYFLEMNPRFGGQYPFCHLAGADFPRAIVKMLLGQKVSNDLLSAKQGVVGYKDLVPVTLSKPS